MRKPHSSVMKKTVVEHQRQSSDWQHLRATNPKDSHRLWLDKKYKKRAEKRMAKLEKDMRGAT